MPKPQEFNEGGSKNPLGVGVHLLKINVDPDLPETIQLQYQEENKKGKFIIPSFNAEGSITDFVPVGAKTMFRIQHYIAALAGRTQKKKQQPNDDTARFIYNELLPGTDPKKVLTWERVFSDYNNFDSAEGCEKFVEWIRKRADRPFWGTVQTKVDQNGGVSRYNDLAVFPPNHIQACKEDEVSQWRGGEAEESVTEAATEEAAL